MDRTDKIRGFRERVSGRQGEIEQLRADLKALQEQLAEEVRLDEQDRRRAAFEEAQERGRQWKEECPEEHAAFLEEIRQRNRQSVLDGAKQGWWDVDDDGNMLAPAIVIDSAELPDGAVMAHVMAKAGIFPSISQARKNGWDKPLTKGMVTVTKKRIRIKVV